LLQIQSVVGSSPTVTRKLSVSLCVFRAPLQSLLYKVLVECCGYFLLFNILLSG
jgi:hypothetical protein